MIPLRRALLSSRNTYLRRSSALLHRSNLSHLVAASSATTDLSRRTTCYSGYISTSQSVSFMLESRKTFAKLRRQEYGDEDYDNEGNAFENANIGRTVKASAVSQMEAAIESLTRELTKLRTGRASPGMLDHIMVESDGTKKPLSRLAVVSVLDPKTLAISPYDPNTLKELEKAIVSSPLGINPKPDNQRLLAPIPPLTKEHTQAICKVVAKSSEDVKQSIRRARQKAFDTIKKSLPKKEKKDSKKDKDKSPSSFSVDDAKRLEKEIDDLTKKFIKSAEDLCKAKEKEITGG